MITKTYKELDIEARAILTQISGLEAQWETEADPEKLAKIESKIDRLDTRKDHLYERMDKMSEVEDLEKPPGKLPEEEEESKPEKEEFICEDCGGDLKEVGNNLYECVNCGEVYEEDG